MTCNNRTALMELQIGKQVSFATGVTPTAKLMGIGESPELVPHVISTPVPEQRGSLSPAWNATLDEKHAEGSIPLIPTYEDICYWLDMHFGEATPTGTDPYTRVYTGAGECPAPYIGSLVWGSTLDAKKMIGSIGKTLELTIEKNVRWAGSVGLVAHSIEDSALEVLGDRIVNFIHGNQTALYIDPDTGIIGTTELATQNHTLGLSLDNAAMVDMGIGSVSPVSYGHNKQDAGANAMNVSMALAAQSYGLLDAVLASTETKKYLFRVLAQISASLSLQIDYSAFIPEAPVVYTDVDGIASVDLQMQPIVDTTLGGWIEITVINGVAVLP